MRTRLLPLWALCLTALAGCDGLLDDLSGSLCNPDGTCPDGYYCAQDTGRCQWGTDPNPPPPDGGQDGGTDGGPDGGGCGGVGLSACINDDACCPAGCHANNDNDCQAVCGNGQVEASGGEVCDDSNTLNGDNCDPTCRYFNTMATLSGAAGSRSFADGTRDIARFHGPAGITTEDGGTFFITDSNSSTVRQFARGSVSTLAGLSFFKQSVDGQGSDAGFASPGDVAFLNGVLYVVDAPNGSGSKLRRVALDGGVTTPDAGISLAGLRGIASDGSEMLLVDNTGLRRWSPGTGTTTLLVPETRLTQVAGAPCEDVTEGPEQDMYYLACNRAIVQYSATDGGVALFAGSLSNTGCTDADGGLLSARFTAARSLDWVAVSSSSSRLYIADPSCHTVQQIEKGKVSTAAGTPGSPGYVNSTNPLTARFNRPFAVETFSPFLGEPTVFVTDSNNAALRSITPQGTFTVAGSPPNTTFTYADAGTEARYTQVSVLAVDGKAGVLYAYSPSARRLFTVDLETGASTEVLAFTGSVVPVGIAVLSDSTVYLAMNNRTVVRLDTSSSPPTLLLVAGQVNSTSPPQDGPLTNAILTPSDMISHTTTEIFFIDQSARTVRKIDLPNGVVTTLAGGNTGSDGGTQGMVDGVGANARFVSPKGLTTDGKNLYLLDGLNPQFPRSVVRKVDLATNTVSTLAGDPLAQGPGGARDGVGSAARFAGAAGLTTDGRVLFISDPGGGYGQPDLTSPAIRMLDLSTLQVTTTVGTRGQWTLRNASGTNAAINAPGPIGFDPVGKQILFFDSEEGVFQRLR